MLAINEFKPENEKLKSRVTNLEKSKLKNDVKMRNMAKRIYKFEPIGFRSVIKKMLSKNENQEK